MLDTARYGIPLTLVQHGVILRPGGLLYDLSRSVERARGISIGSELGRLSKHAWLALDTAGGGL